MSITTVALIVIADAAALLLGSVIDRKIEAHRSALNAAGRNAARRLLGRDA